MSEFSFTRAFRIYADKSSIWRRGYVTGVRYAADPDVTRPLPNFDGWGEDYKAGFTQGTLDCALRGCTGIGANRIPLPWRI